MIGHVLHRLLRLFFRHAGIKVGPRRLGRCAECLTHVWDDDKRVRVHGVWFHENCAQYMRRSAA